MGDIKDLSHVDGIKKLKEMVDSIGTCMFCTKIENMPFETRPMSTSQVDDDGNFWFFSSKESGKNIEIKKDDEVQLIYSKNSDAHFLSVYGHAEISKDRAKIDELWTKLAEAWFKGGKDDPNLTLICVKPSQAYYWDTKDGKMITLLKIAISAITGNGSDGGVEGQIKI